MRKKDITKTWREYESGIDYKTLIDLYKTVDENLRFYEGDQWCNIKAPDMPKPVFNYIERAGNFMAIQISDRKTKLKYVTEGERDEVVAILNQMDDYGMRTWDRLRMDEKNLEGLIDAFNTGDYLLYHWWDDDIETGQPFKGDINSMLLDGVNVYPGNPNEQDIQKQPYIIIAMRDMVANVRKIAKKNKISAEKIKMILPDEETDYTAGDMGKYELEGGEKCNVLLKMWKEINEETGKPEVYFAKATRHVDVMKKKRAKLKLYPIAKMSWKPRKNCFHGTAQTTYIKSNQVFINKQMAFIQAHLLQTAFPSVLFSKSVFPDGWSNKVSAARGIAGDDVSNVAKYMAPPTLPSDVWVGVDKTLKTTMELMGVNDAAMGNIANPNNKSAFIAVRDAAIVPLESQQQRFHNMMRDVGMIYMDFWINHYPEGRMIPVEDEGETVLLPFAMKDYEDMLFDVRIEVGESRMWSEMSEAQTLDNLLKNKLIPLSLYAELMPEGNLPGKSKIIEHAKKMEKQQAQMQEMQMQQAQGGVA